MRATVTPEQIDEVFAQWDTTSAPGCALAIIQNDSIIYSRGYGCANLEYGIPITPASVFYTGSVAKQFTALAILMLAQQGALSLDDLIRRYVPELPDYCEPITLRHLIHHTSGLRDYLTLFVLAGKRSDDAYTNGDVLAILRRQHRLNFTPGSRHSYSNSGYVLLAMTVQRVAGRTLREYAQEHIFGPFGMYQTHFRDDHTMLVPHRAYAYARGKEGAFQLCIPHFDIVGDGGLMSTVEDLGRWDRNFYPPYTGGRALIDHLQTPGVLATGERLSYACGLYIDSYRGLAIVQHSGGYGGYGAQLLRFPAQRFSVACLCNTVEANPSALAFRIAALYLGDQLALPQPTAPTAAQTSLEDVGARTDLGQYAGAYLSEELDATYTIDVIDGALGVSTGISTGALTLGIALDKVSLQSSGPDEFAGPWFIRMRFNRTERGDISGFDLTMPRAEQIPFLLQRC